MSSLRPWAIGRRIQYGMGFASFCILVGFLFYYASYYQPASCFDNVMNGEEREVDCGGACVLICAADVMSPKIIWAKSFEVGKGQYNAVALVENPNQIAGIPEMNYTFQFFHDGEMVAERSGITEVPPNSVFPIFEGKVIVDTEQEITETSIVLEPVDKWRPASVERDQFRAVDISLLEADTRPRLDAKIENTKLTDAENVEVVAIILNDRGEPVTASRTYIDRIASRSIEKIVFTWPNSIAKTVRSCEVPTDVVIAIDLSGSMNNDGGDPPQPITDTLDAAGQFANTLKENDQVSVVTFATQAGVVTELTNLHDTVANSILSLTIDPVEETGFTNTGEALTVAQKELNSERHNADARRVLVLLTDGLPTAEGDDDVVAEAVSRAVSLSEDDIEIYAIGLGQNVDQEFIHSIASDRLNAYLAPTVNDLRTIYTEITSSLCEVGVTKKDVIAKPKANFAPLR